MEGHSRDADESDGSESHLLTYYYEGRKVPLRPADGPIHSVTDQHGFVWEICWSNREGGPESGSMVRAKTHASYWRKAGDKEWVRTSLQSLHKIRAVLVRGGCPPLPDDDLPAITGPYTPPPNLTADLTMLVRRLCRKLPVGDKLRAQAEDYLVRKGLNVGASILR
jgi:hypothetical protein